MTEKQHRADFDYFDQNKDGFVDAQEMREVNPKLTQNDISEFFLESDKNEDGKITVDEYLHSQYANRDVVLENNEDDEDDYWEFCWIGVFTYFDFTFS